MIMKQLVQLALCASSLIGLTACSVMPTEPAQIDFKPVMPEARTTAYTKPLQCLGDLYRTYSDKDQLLLIGVMPATDVTGANQFTSAEVPREFTLMVEAAVNSISPRIRLSNVDHDFVVKEASVGGRFARMTPQLLLKPGITEFDRGITIKQKKKDMSGFFGKGKGATDFSGDSGEEDVTSRLAVDMLAYDYATMVSMPQVHSSISAEVGRKSKEQSWSFSVYGWGTGASSVSKAIQGRHEAVRILTEYAVLQTLGRYLKLPYWRCVEGMAEDVTLKQTLSKAHSSMQAQERISSVQELLQYHGFKDIKPTGAFDATTRQAFNTATLANPQVSADPNGADAYYHLYVSIPVSNVPDPRGWRLIRSLSPHNPPKAKAVATSDANAGGLSLTIYNPVISRGDKVNLRLTTRSDAYAWCFLQEATGDIKLIYPNRFAQSAYISAGQVLALPGQMRFNLSAHEQGQAETVACITTAHDVKAQLPMNAKDFVALPFRSLDEVVQLMTKLDDTVIGIAQVRIQAP
jgi:Domain of unknown function (DUF4384)